MSKTFNVGDRVTYTRKFMKCTGMISSRKGTVVSLLGVTLSNCYGIKWDDYKSSDYEHDPEVQKYIEQFGQATQSVHLQLTR